MPLGILAVSCDVATVPVVAVGVIVANTSILNAFLHTNHAVSQYQSISLVVRLYATAGFVVSAGLAGGVTSDVDVYTCCVHPDGISSQDTQSKIRA